MNPSNSVPKHLALTGCLIFGLFACLCLFVSAPLHAEEPSRDAIAPDGPPLSQLELKQFLDADPGMAPAFASMINGLVKVKFPERRIVDDELKLDLGVATKHEKARVKTTLPPLTMVYTNSELRITVPFHVTADLYFRYETLIGGGIKDNAHGQATGVINVRFPLDSGYNAAGNRTKPISILATLSQATANKGAVKLSMRGVLTRSLNGLLADASNDIDALICKGLVGQGVTPELKRIRRIFEKFGDRLVDEIKKDANPMNHKTPQKIAREADRLLDQAGDAPKKVGGKLKRFFKKVF